MDFVTNSSSSSFIISKKNAFIDGWTCGCENWNCDCPKEKEIDIEYINAVLKIAYNAANEIYKLKGDDYDYSSPDLDIIETDSLTPEELEEFIEEQAGGFRYDCTNEYCYRCPYEVKATGYPDKNGYISCHDYRRCRDENKDTMKCKLVEDLIRESKFLLNDFDSVPEEIHEMLCTALNAEYYRFA